MKKLFILFVVIISFAGGYFLKDRLTNSPSFPSPQPTIFYSNKHKVTKVIDGDTIVIDTNEKVCYLGMDEVNWHLDILMT